MDRVKHHLGIVESALSGAAVNSKHRDCSMLLAELISLHSISQSREIILILLNVKLEFIVFSYLYSHKKKGGHSGLPSTLPQNQFGRRVPSFSLPSKWR
jgi:hypothetical protein